MPVPLEESSYCIDLVRAFLCASQGRVSVSRLAHLRIPVGLTESIVIKSPYVEPLLGKGCHQRMVSQYEVGIPRHRRPSSVENENHRTRGLCRRTCRGCVPQTEFQPFDWALNVESFFRDPRIGLSGDRCRSQQACGNQRCEIFAPGSCLGHVARVTSAPAVLLNHNCPHFLEYPLPEPGSLLMKNYPLSATLDPERFTRA